MPPAALLWRALAGPEPGHGPMPTPLVVALAISCAAFVLVVGGLILIWLNPWNRRAHAVAWSGVALGAVSIGIRLWFFASAPPL